MTTILLLRHAEKLDWPDGKVPDVNAKDLYNDNHVLSPKGCERAYALVGYFLHRDELKTIFDQRPLQALIAQDCESGQDAWGRSERPRQTLEPLRSALQNSLRLDDGLHDPSSNISHGSVDLHLFTKKNVATLTDQINRGAYAGKSVIVCWSHQQMPVIAELLGVDRDQIPDKWPKKRFDLVWVLEKEHGPNERCTLRQMPQRLLYGDRDDVQ